MKQYKTKCFIKFLETLGCVEKRTKGSHTAFSCPKCLRSVTIRKADKEIPEFHIRTNLRTLNINFDSFQNWASQNC